MTVWEREQAEADLVGFRSDLALIFEPAVMVVSQVIHALLQPVCGVFEPDHPLASKRDLRLRPCLDHAHVAPASNYGVRVLLDAAAKRIGRGRNPTVQTESFELIRHYVQYEGLAGFQIPIGLTDAALGKVCFLGQLSGRALSVASLRFADQLRIALTEMADRHGPFEEAPRAGAT